MIRKALLGAVASAALLATGPARAQGVPVIDVAQLAQWAQQLQEMMRHYQVLMSQLRTAEAQLASLQRTTDISGLAGGLMGLRSPFGMDPTAITGLLTGRGGGLLGGVLGATEDRNRIYENPGTDFYAQEQNRRRRAIAGQQAANEELMRQAAERIPLLEELQARLATATDPAEKLDLQARIAAEQAHLQNLKIQADSVNAYATAELASFKQRRDEQIQMEIDEAVAALEADRAARFGGQ